jgi:PPOX class probable F420-dependent enzyme
VICGNALPANCARDALSEGATDGMPYRVCRNINGMPIPAEISGQKYISLTTFRKTGSPVRTPLWFAEANGKLYVMTRNDSWKYKRIRNNPKVLVAPCTMRGTVTGADFEARALILPREQWLAAKQLLARKYWIARLPFWSSKNEYIEIEVGS